MASAGPWSLLAAAVLAGTVALHDVPAVVTAEDRSAAERIVAEAGYVGAMRLQSSSPEFEVQISTIVAVQDAVLKATPKNSGIALDRGRELKDLYELRQGLCFDRSRAMEKILSSLGYATRHASIYSTAERSALLALLTPDNPSHAVTEVLTAKGWMVIESNFRWIGLDASRRPVSLAGLKALSDRAGPWAGESRKPINGIFLNDFVFVRGLYSRHGRFFPPYTPIPDVSLAGLMENFAD